MASDGASDGASPNWYAVLAVDTAASADQIRKAFHKLALKYHPDKNSGESAAQDFDLARQAFSVLSNDDLRAQYDAEIGIISEKSSWIQTQRYERERTEEAYFAQKLAAQERGTARSARKTAPNTNMEALKREVELQKEALAEILESHERDNPEYRTLSDRSRVFDTIAEARDYIDQHTDQKLLKSYKSSQYTEVYESATLARLRRRAEAQS